MQQAFIVFGPLIETISLSPAAIILCVLSLCVTCIRHWNAPNYVQDAMHHAIGDVVNSKRPLLIIPKVQLRLRVTRRSWQKLFAGKNFVKILVTAQTQLRSCSEQQRAFGNSNICILQWRINAVIIATTTIWAAILWVLWRHTDALYYQPRTFNYRLITAYLLLRVNLDKIMHARWDFNASSAQAWKLKRKCIILPKFSSTK